MTPISYLSEIFATLPEKILALLDLNMTLETALSTYATQYEEEGELMTQTSY